jgi:hypothetical protein
MSMRYKGGIISATAPTTSTSAASGVWTRQQHMQALGGSGWPLPIPYYMQALYSAGQEAGTATTATSTSLIVGGTSYSPYGMAIANYNYAGTLQWQKYTSRGTPTYGNAVGADSAGNYYVGGWVSNSGNYREQLVKVDSTGTTLWSKGFCDSATSIGDPSGSINSIFTDSSNNVYTVFRDGGGWLVKLNSAGTVQWSTSMSDGYYSIGALDTSNNVYVIGSVKPSTLWILSLMKVTSTGGSALWQRSLTQTGAYTFDVGLGVDSSNNVYILGTTTISATTSFVLAKYNSSGTIQWQRGFGLSGTTSPYKLAVDSAGNCYAVGTSTASGTANMQIVKYNSSGTIQWQRSIVYGTAVGGTAASVSLTSDSLVISGTWNSTSGDIAFLKLPLDGSRTGTYTLNGTTVVYAASSLTDTATSLTDAAGTFAIAAGTIGQDTTALSMASLTKSTASVAL